MNLKQLAYFVQVAELGNFTRGASVLRVAQPVLSRQVRLFEVALHQHSLTATAATAATAAAAAA